MLDRDISLKEKVGVIDHYTQQLKNSGHSYSQMRDIIESSLKGIIRQEERRQAGEKRYKCSSDTLEIRAEKFKMQQATQNF